MRHYSSLQEATTAFLKAAAAGGAYVPNQLLWLQWKPVRSLGELEEAVKAVLQAHKADAENWIGDHYMGPQYYPEYDGMSGSLSYLSAGGTKILLTKQGAGLVTYSLTISAENLESLRRRMEAALQEESQTAPVLEPPVQKLTEEPGLIGSEVSEREEAQ